MNKDGCPPGQKKVGGECKSRMQIHELNETDARKLYQEYTPSMIGVTSDGYNIFPLSPKEALLLKTKKGKFIDGVHVKLSHSKRMWHDATMQKKWERATMSPKWIKKRAVK